MLIFLLSYLGGILTIFSPCVLPILPFVFAKHDQSFKSSGLPILLGMMATFTTLASLAAVGGAWLIELNQYGRYAAMLLLLLMGIALIFPSLAERLMRPFVTLGGRLQQNADSTPKGSFLLGMAIGFLWAPCAGPILGLVLAGAALNGANLYSALLLLVFAAGAATSLSAALLAGGRFFSMMKRALGAEVWLRRGLGVTVVAGVVIIAAGWDTRFLSQFAFLHTTDAEQRLIAKFGAAAKDTKPAAMPPLSDATQWINSPPLTPAMLRGKVVLVDFWTYSCINCLRTLPYLEAWDKKYRDQGLVIIGVHTPEFAFEKDAGNVRQAVRDLNIAYPVAMDNRYAIWDAYQNQYWPAHYLIDAKGQVRDQHSGEGAYVRTEQMIQKLLNEAGRKVTANLEKVADTTSQAVRSPETYLGYARAQNFSSREAAVKDTRVQYSPPDALDTDHWSLDGQWLISAESVESKAANDAISYRFQGHDLHLVMGGEPVRFKVTLDGKAPGINHGTDIDENGYGVIREQRLYRLIKLSGPTSPHIFRIEFLDKGAQAFAFTFG